MNLNFSVSSTNVHEKSKILQTGGAAASHAGPELLLLAVAFDRQRDQTIQIEEWMIGERVFQREPSPIEVFAECLSLKLDNASCFTFHCCGSWHSDMYLGRL